MSLQQNDFGRRAYLAQIAQRLSEPADAILGCQELIVEDARDAGLTGAQPDLDRVLAAARTLSEQVHRLVAGDLGQVADSLDVETSLRHELRTPISAILGYSEMVVEDFGDALPEVLVADINRVIRESKSLLGRIDDIVSFSRSELNIEYGSDSEAAIAAGLSRTIAAHPTPTIRDHGNILVIDDTASSRDVLSRRLKRSGHNVTALSSAHAALMRLEVETFDLILIDILMPDMNGIELLACLKGDARWRSIPVVMVSGLKEDDAVIRCIEAGAEDYLTKPVDPVLLRARICSCLERGRWRERERGYLAEIERERERADTLLHAVLPSQVVRRLANGETVIADKIDIATILFADIVNFTEHASRTSPSTLVSWLGALFSRFDQLAERYGVEKIKTIGDAYMAAAGLPDPRPDHAEAAVALGRAMIHEMKNSTEIEPALRLRVGIHTGPVVAGVIGRKRFVYDIWGHTVNVASRLESLGLPGRIQISQATLAAISSSAVSVAAREIDIRGVGRATVYIVD
ncbi:adenylate/guanylate cyclase domain-containing protein [Aurantimonas sp. A2-1-M11]|uniref:adenylate/guanylate cyclase domain-containing protein n=1 Tax=Aurantimonas sp. A2-1-M11 TaxID=3113712 RepID=UPI002F95FF17